jgi:hypothetical protein
LSCTDTWVPTHQAAEGQAARYGIPSAHCISPAPAIALLCLPCSQSSPVSATDTDEPRGLALAAAPLQVAPHRPTSRRRQSSACIPTQLNYPSSPSSLSSPSSACEAFWALLYSGEAREIQGDQSIKPYCAVQCSCAVLCAATTTATASASTHACLQASIHRASPPPPAAA